MFRITKSIKSKGYTLVELLAVMTLLAIVSVIIIGLTVTSLKNYRNISAESALRDEADLILSQVYSSMYKVRESTVCETPDLTSTAGVTIIKHVESNQANTLTCQSSATNTIGLTGPNEFSLFNGQVYRVTNKEITVDSFHFIKKAPGSYEFNLTLKLNGKKLTRKFNNQVRTIYDM
jgi:prepilin-type N-terminal cleavage/methylation domain-containing protein